MAVANSLAYNTIVLITIVKSFILRAHEVLETGVSGQILTLIFFLLHEIGNFSNCPDQQLPTIKLQS